MSSLRVVAVADNKGWIDTAVHEYADKLSYLSKFSLDILKPTKIGRQDSAIKQQKESQSILSKIKDNEFVILCDERGKTYDSKKFAQKIDQFLNDNPNPKCFVIGGAFGADEDLKKRADMTLRLSDLTYNHHIALIVLLEQLYRSLTIIKNIPYHND